MSFLQIFDVQHGSCALFTADNGRRIMIDCGANTLTGWSPARELKAVGATLLEMLVVTNYDEDHVQGLPELRHDFFIETLWRTPNVTPSHIIELKSEDGMGPGIAELVNMAEAYSGASTVTDDEFGNIQMAMFWNSRADFSDENNLSAIFLLQIKNTKFLFTGDMECAGFDKILQRADVRDAVAGCSVLIAPHHGRASAVHHGFLDLARPYWTVISDKGYMYSTQETVPTYRYYSRGAEFRGEQRSVLTTRRDGTIEFWFNNGQWGAN